MKKKNFQFFMNGIFISADSIPVVPKPTFFVYSSCRGAHDAQLWTTNHDPE